MSNARVPAWRAWLAFGLLCGFGACRWMIPAVLSGTETKPISVLAGVAVLTLWAGVRAFRSGDARPAPHQLLWAIAGGALLLAGFALPGLVPEARLYASDATMALSLTPVVLAVAQGALGEGDRPSPRLWPGLASCAGLLLLLPQPHVSSAPAVAWLLAMPLLCGLGAALLTERTSADPWAQAGAGAGALLVAGAAALHAALAGTAQSFGAALQGFWPTDHASLLLMAALADGTHFLLSLWTLLSIGAMRWSGQFAVVPLLVILEGLVFLRPALDVRSVAGTGLLLAATWLLLHRHPEEAQQGRLTVLK